MTAVKYVGGLIRGTNAERIALSTTNLRAGWLFVCSDTLDIYYWTGSAWTVITNATGEANTASNVGAGQGVWKSKTGVDLSFRSLTATSSKIALANNANDIGIDVTEANLTHDNIGGTLGVAKGGTGATTLTGVLKGSGTSAFTAVTAPSGAIVGTTDTQSLSGKTMDTIAGTNSLIGVQTSPLDSKQVGMWHGPVATNSCASGFWAVLFTNNLTGTGGWTINKTSTGVNARADTGNTINSLCGMRCASGNTVVRGDLNTNFGMRAALTNAGANLVRCYIGFTSNAAAAASTADPLNALSGIGFWYDSGVDTNWHICQNDGTGASDRTTINVGAGASGTIKDFWLRSTAATTWQYSFATRGTAYASLTWSNIVTDIPVMTTAMGYLWYVEALASTNSKPVDFYGGVGWQDCN